LVIWFPIVVIIVDKDDDDDDDGGGGVRHILLTMNIQKKDFTNN